MRYNFRVNKSLLTYLSALLLFGTNGFVASHIDLSSYQIVFLRSTIGAAVLAAFYLAAKRRFTCHKHRRQLAFLSLSGVAMAANWLFLYEGYQTIGVSLATLMCYCGPILVVAASPLAFRERITLPKIAGMTAAVIGFALINGNVFSGEANLWGLFCGAMSAVAYAIMVIANKKAPDITGLENATVQLATGCIAVAAFTFANQGIPIAVQPTDWPWVAVLGVVNTGFGCFLYFSPLSKLPAQTIAICGYLEPLSAVAFSIALLGEPLSLALAAGGALIIGGTLCAELLRDDRATHTAQEPERQGTRKLDS